MRRRSLFLILALTISVSCKVSHKSRLTDGGFRLIDTSISTDNRFEAIIKPYRDSLSKEMDKVIGIAPNALTKAQPEGALGNFMADAMLETGNLHFANKADFAIMNYGGIRLPAISSGNVTKGRIFELMPFDNTLVLLDLDGNTATKLFDLMASKGGWPVSRGTSFVMSGAKVSSVTINGRPLARDGMYKVLISDYLANGGDYCEFLVQSKREDKGILIRDILIEHIERVKVMIGEVEGRIRTY